MDRITIISNIENHYIENIRKYIGETYCYSLTLAMITKLPIISINKNYDSVIKNRLLKYDKSYFFESINDSKYNFDTLPVNKIILEI